MTTRRRFLFLLPPLLFSLAPAFGEESTLTLPQAIDLALSQNIDIRAAEDDLGIFRSQYRQAVGAVIGDIKGTASYGRNFRKPAFFLSATDPATGGVTQQKITIGADNAFAAGLTFEQPLFSGGKLYTGIVAGKTRIRAGEEGVRAAREEVVLATKQFFYAFLLADSTITIADDNLKLSEEHLATIRERYRQGLESDLAVLRQEVEVASAKTGLIQARNMGDLAITNLQKVLYLDIEKPLRPTGDLRPPAGDPPPYDEVVRLALGKNPSIEIARLQTVVAANYHRIVRADYFPTLNGFVDYSWSAQSDDFAPGPGQRNDSLGAGVRLEWNFFTGGETRQRVVQAKIEWERARDLETKIEREIRVAVKQQWLNVIEAAERARSQETAVGQAKRALEATEVRFKMGRASQLEQNDATFALNRARTIHAQASHDYWVARAGLEKAMGTTLEEIR
jgi:outer membrane protein TolC